MEHSPYERPREAERNNAAARGNSRLSRLALAVAAATLIAAAAFAGAGGPADPGGKNVPPEIPAPPPESTAPPPDPATGGDKPKVPLSEQLREGEGVIAPPHGVDPGIKKPIPDDFKSKTPVIPPPGEPGGDQSVQPK